jgi:hypothetical protein
MQQNAPLELTPMYDVIISDIGDYVKTIPQAPPFIQYVNAAETLLEALYVARNARDVSAIVSLVQKVVEGLLEHYVPIPLGADSDIRPDVLRNEIMRFRDAHIYVLRNLQDGRACGVQVIARYVTK